MKKLFYILLLLLFVAPNGFSQGAKQQKADKYFETYSFAEAINKYEGVLEKSINVKRNLAISYLKTGKLVEAEDYYKQVANNVTATPEDLFSYASVLRINKKYELADAWMEKFHQAKPNDKRGMLNSKSRGKYKEFLKNDGLFIIRNLESNTAYEDFGASFYKDQIVFASSQISTTSLRKEWNWNQLPYLDVFVADRNENYNLSEPKKFKPVSNKKYHEGPTAFNKAGDYMVLTRNNYKGKSTEDVVKLQLFYSEFEDDKWGEFKPMPFNHEEYSVGHATLTADGNTLYFASDLPGGKGGVDLYKSIKNTGGTWGQPINLGDEINTEGDEMFPFIHEKGILFFASNGHVGLGGLDVFMCNIDKNDQVSNIKNLGVPINSNKDDFAFILNEEQTNGYYSSNRTGGKGKDDIYTFRMTRPFGSEKIIQGIAKDTEGKILANTDVVLLKSDGKGVAFVMTNEDGKFEFNAKNNLDYFILASNDDYVDNMTYVDTYTEERVINKDVVLALPAKFSVVGTVLDNKTNKPLKGVQINIINNQTQEKEVLTTSGNGTYTLRLDDKKMNDEVSYSLSFSKSKYMNKTIDFVQKLNHEGEYEITTVIGIPEVGVDIGKMINVSPIYFDYNKFNIRSDAQVELDKIVAVMNEYPNMEVELGSHTDCRGKDAYNETLSNKRAKASANYIQSKITNPSRIYGKGYGESQPINNCNCGSCTEEEHQENRRTEFKVISMGVDVK